MKVLVINSGSSSLKFEVIDTKTNESLAKGLCERIGIANPLFTYKNLLNGKSIKEAPMDFKNHEMAINTVLKELVSDEYGVLKDINEIDAIGHRVVQGGEYFDDSCVVGEKEIKLMKELYGLAPLHNPANVMGIEIMQKLLPNKKNVAVFDTSFHRTLAPAQYIYPLPYEDYTELKVRKYGAHGTSHKYVSQKAIEMLGNPKESKIIVCHLGNGASITAVKNGKSIDTSMGLTPLAGVMMGTRCGDIDPAAVLYVAKQRGLTSEQMDTRMNKQSGILGVTGKSSDYRDLDQAVREGNERAKLAYDLFVSKIRNYIGMYIVELGGLDALVFTGGIGENAASAREGICKNLEFLGIELDIERNKERIPGDVDYSKQGSKVRIYKIETAEELMIAKDTERLLK